MSTARAHAAADATVAHGASYLQLEVADVSAEAKDILVLELRAPDGRLLPGFDPGAHLEVRLPNGLVRHYSLISDGHEPCAYQVAVGRARPGRGGSAWLHQDLRRGSVLEVSAPRNNFRLDPRARRYLFIAGGIGITPILSMIRWCEAHRRSWRLVYAARSKQRAAFYEELSGRPSRTVHLHFDDEHQAQLDLSALLAGRMHDEQVYCCGPEPMMREVASETSSLPAGSVHFEWFTASRGSADDAADRPAAAGSFEVRLKRRGVTLTIPPDRSILEVVEANGVAVPNSCREGLCRTCETTVCAGDPQHNDYVLSEEERAQGRTMMICVSRAVSPILELDL